MISKSTLLLIFSLTFLIGNISAFWPRRLVKRQVVSCYNQTGTYLGYCLGGSCSIKAYNLYTCNCPDGTHRLDCTTPLSVVTASPSKTCAQPCQNGGICVIGLCFCPITYTGTYCQTSISSSTTGPCTGIVCQNGGMCMVSNNLAYCNCGKTGFTGPYCNIAATTAVVTTTTIMVDPCATFPCYNGGVCIYFASLAVPTVCACRAGYTGDHCQIPYTTTATSTTTVTTTTTTVAPPFACSLLPTGNPCLTNTPCLVVNNIPLCYCTPAGSPTVC